MSCRASDPRLPPTEEGSLHEIYREFEAQHGIFVHSVPSYVDNELG